MKIYHLVNYYTALSGHDGEWDLLPEDEMKVRWPVGLKGLGPGETVFPTRWVRYDDLVAFLQDHNPRLIAYL